MLKKLRRALCAFVRRRDPLAQPFNLAFEKATSKIFNRRGRTVLFYPQSITYGVTTYCNLRCEMCAVYTLPKRRRGHMSFKDFYMSLSQFPAHQMRLVLIQGTGEPLLNPDLAIMLKHAKKKGFITGMFTNGTLMNEKKAAQLVRGLDWINFSIDGAKKETYEAVRKGVSFNEVKNNVFTFGGINRKLRANVTVGINFVANKLNYLEIVDLIILAHELRVDFVNVIACRSSSFRWEHRKYDSKVRLLQRMNPLELKRQVAEAAHLSRRLGIDFSFEFLGAPPSKCTWPWDGCYVTHDGYVTPCCGLANPETINFGNLFEISFKEIWNNSAYQEFRYRLASDKPPRVCVGCGL